MGFLLRASLSCFVLIVGVASVSSPPEEIRKKPSLMRKATDGKEAAKLESDGVVVDAKPTAADLKAKAADLKAKLNLKDKAANLKAKLKDLVKRKFAKVLKAQQAEADDKLPSSLCRAVFVRGDEKTGQCRQADIHHKKIEDEHECHAIAAMTQADWGDAGLLKESDQDWEDSHPIGCFSRQCPPESGAQGRTCMYFSALETQKCGTGKDQTPCKGEPVCWTQRYQVGTGEGCPANYQEIKEEQHCRAAASCSGIAAAAKMLIGEEHYDRITDRYGVVQTKHPWNMAHNKYARWCSFQSVKSTDKDSDETVAFFNKFAGKVDEPQGLAECNHECHSAHHNPDDQVPDYCFQATKAKNLNILKNAKEVVNNLIGKAKAR